MGEQVQVLSEVPWWRQFFTPLPEFLIGFDKDGDDDKEEGEEDESEESEDDEDDEDEDDDDEGEKDKKGEKSGTRKSKSSEEDRAAGLKSALRKERAARRTLAKELKELKSKIPDPDKEKADKDKADSERESAAQKAQAEAERQKSERLAARLATNAVDTAIVKVAAEKKMPQFKDIDDAMRLIDRKGIDVEQDDDDPSNVEVDLDDVRDALKALAKSKPHLLAEKKSGDEGDGKGGKTGSKFGRKTPEQEKAAAAALRRKYPALGNRR